MLLPLFEKSKTSHVFTGARRGHRGSSILCFLRDLLLTASAALRRIQNFTCFYRSTQWSQRDLYSLLPLRPPVKCFCRSSKNPELHMILQEHAVVTERPVFSVSSATSCEMLLPLFEESRTSHDFTGARRGHRASSILCFLCDLLLIASAALQKIKNLTCFYRSTQWSQIDQYSLLPLRPPVKCFCRSSKNQELHMLLQEHAEVTEAFVFSASSATSCILCFLCDLLLNASAALRRIQNFT
jgi:ascorbate-specific PTS system EIIC-type component UlaA